MAKETYYFSHDYNARNDRKIAALIKDYKSSGYGIFWATCEMMHEEGGSLEFDDLTIDAIAKDMNENSEYVREVLDTCVDKYRLFARSKTKQNEAENFASLLHSGRVERNLEGKNEKREKKSLAGKAGGIKSGESRRNNFLAKQNEAPRSTASQIEAKESKVKESKVNNNTPEYPDVGENVSYPVKIHSFKNVRVNVFNKCESWALKEIVKFITESQPHFEKIAMSNRVLGTESNFQTVVQAFVDMIQSTGEYQQAERLRSHFSHWVAKKNGSLENFISEQVAVSQSLLGLKRTVNKNSFV